MWVKGLSIDGFGVFCGREFGGLSQGLTVLYGANEAGKSTLLGFLRGVLFGLPRATKSRRAFYPPLAGGRHGGRVFLGTEAGEITVEREAGRAAKIVLRSPEGAAVELTDGELQQLLGGVDAQTFQTVFAFSLDELRNLDSLDGEQIRARIFAAGVGGAGPSAREVIQAMERTCGGLLKPRSTDAEINRILAELAAQDRRLGEVRAAAEGYPGLLSQRESLRGSLERSAKRGDELRLAQNRLERLLELWPAWVDLDSTRRELEGLQVVEEFVPDATRRLAEVKGAVESSARSLERLEERSASRSAEIAELQEGLRDDLADIASAVEQQVAAAPRYRERMRDREDVRGRIAVIQDRLDRALREIGSEVDERDLDRVDTSLPRIEELRGMRSSLAEAARKTASAIDSLDAAARQKAKAETDRDREREVLGALPRGEHDVLMERTRAMRVLRSGAAELRAKEAELEGRRAALSGVAAVGGSPRPRGGAATATLLAAGVVLLAAAAGAAVADIVRLAVGLGIVAVPCLVVGAVFLALHRSRPGTRPADRQAWDVRAREEEQRQIRLGQEIADLRSRFEGPAAVLGVVDPRDAHELERAEAALAESSAQAAAWGDQAAVVARAEKVLEAAILEESLAESRLQRSRQEEETAWARFQSVISDWGLPGELSPDGVEQWLRGLNTAKDLVGRRDEERVSLDRFEQECRDWEEQSVALVSRFGGSRVADGEGVEQALSSLAEQCRRDAEARARLADLLNTRRELEVEIEGARAELGAAESRMQSFFESAGVEDEEGFLRRLSIYEKRQEVARVVEVGEGMLVKSLGLGPPADEIRSTLATGEVAAWEEQLDLVRAEAVEIAGARSELIKAEGEVERLLRELEDSADVPSVETVIAGLETELDTALERWRVHQLAARLVRDTLARFARERQPRVLAEASRMFERVTHGRYQQVLRSAEEEGIVVCDSAGRTKSPEELSRGTAEQLYLCLRLALAEEFARRAEPMPVVMDDVLVNFDSARRRSTAELLIDFAKSHQVLLFTCHEEIVRLVQDLQPNVGMVELT